RRAWRSTSPTRPRSSRPRRRRTTSSASPSCAISCGPRSASDRRTGNGGDMQSVKKAYTLFCKVEQSFVAVLIVAITGLIFGSAVARTLGHPLNITTDLALLMFAWVVFIGADVSLQQADFLRVEILLKTFPLKLQKLLYYVFSVAAILVLALIVYLGVPLAMSNAARLFQTLGISYAWATISAPVGCALMIVTIVLKMIRHRHDSEIVLVQSEAI